MNSPPPRGAAIKWIERLAWLLDEQFRIPRTKFRFGLDPLMNLFPFLGDLSGFFVSGALVIAMAKNGASGRIVALMSINVLLDATIGAIPVLGNVFDFYYKANSRNIKLLKEHYLEGKHQGSAKSVVIIAVVVMLAGLVGLAFITWKIGTWFFGLFS